MYTNIDPSHGIETMRKWFSEYKDELPPDDFSSKLILEALVLSPNNGEQSIQIWRHFLQTTNGNCDGNTSGMHLCHHVLCLSQEESTTSQIQG